MAKQQIEVARYCGVSVIDWNGEMQAGSIRNKTKGSGTQSDPYLVAEGVGKDSDDGMHPNASGGEKLGKLTAKVVKSKFIDLSL